MATHSSRSNHSTPTQADMDVLSMLTADHVNLGPLQQPRATPSRTPSAEHVGGASRPKKQLPRRESPMDALLISAVLAGSGPVTRHHFGHGADRPGTYARCDESRPSTPSKQPSQPPKLVMRSAQAPRSERLRMQHEAERKSQPRSTSTTSPVTIQSSSSRQEPSFSPGTSLAGSLSRQKRRMSTDPQPVSQVLQLAASPRNATNFPQAYAQPGASSGLNSSTTVGPDIRPKVRCMARTRIPTPHGEMFLHLYHNSLDSKEHLAIVFDPIQLSHDAQRSAPKKRREIRSRSLDEVWREGETDMERVVRGAYVGRLVPGGEGQASVPTIPESPEDESKDQDPLAEMEMEMEMAMGMDIDTENEHGRRSRLGKDEEDVPPLVRIHSECFTGETIGSMRCDCGEQLDEALRLISLPQPVPHASSSLSTGLRSLRHAHSLPTPVSSRSASPASASATANTPVPTVPGRGVVIYLRQEGRGIGLLEKIRAYNLQDLGHDTVTANLMLGHGADERKYGVAAEIMRDLGLGGSTEDGVGAGASESGIRLLTNNPEKVEGLAKEGIQVVERVGMVPRDWKCDGQDEGYGEWQLRRSGAGMIGAGVTHGPELEKYLRTKVERMGHMIDIPENRRV